MHMASVAVHDRLNEAPLARRPVPLMASAHAAEAGGLKRLRRRPSADREPGRLRGLDQPIVQGYLV